MSFDRRGEKEEVQAGPENCNEDAEVDERLRGSQPALRSLSPAVGFVP